MSQSKLKTKNRLLPVSLRNSPYLFYLQHTQNELSYNFFIKDSIAWGIIIPPEVIFYLNCCSQRDWEKRKIQGTFFTKCVCVCSVSRVQLFATPWTVARQLHCEWDSPGKSTGVGCHFLLRANRVMGSHSAPTLLKQESIDNYIVLSKAGGGK